MRQARQSNRLSSQRHFSLPPQAGHCGGDLIEGDAVQRLRAVYHSFELLLHLHAVTGIKPIARAVITALNNEDGPQGRDQLRREQIQAMDGDTQGGQITGVRAQ
jgi:hypothetical protein